MLLYIELGKNVNEPNLSELVFSPKRINKIQQELKLTKSGWSNHKKGLIKKKVLVSNEYEELTINPILIPRTELTFKFIIVE